MKRIIIGLFIVAAVAMTACQSEQASVSLKPDALELAVVGNNESVEGVVDQVATQSGCIGDYFLDVQANPTNSGLPAPSLNVNCSGNTLTVQTNEIPTHEVGDFPRQGNPNAISAQNRTYSIPLNPQLATDTSTVQGMRFGLTLGGVSFDPFAAEFYNNDRTSGWSYSAIDINLGMDQSNAHVQPTGSYHYHGFPTLFVEQVSDDDGDGYKLIGFAADGFPLYAAVNLAEASSSYQIKSGTRPSGPGGTYDGTFDQDYEYVEGSGTLDACNGMYGSTSEFPEGTYLYFVTYDYPYVPRCFVGTPDSSFRNGGGGGQGGPGGAQPAGGGQQGPQGGPAGQRGGPGADGQGPDFSGAAAQLGVSEAELQAALGGPPPDFESAAAALGVSVADLHAALRP